MFTFQKSTSSILPYAQGIEDKDVASESEQTSMLDHDYVEEKRQRKSWRLWSSNIPWIITTVALSIYILIRSPSNKRIDTPWSPTDAGKSLEMTEIKHI
jgi:hypothetical protein